jgi:hypothetical protein
LKLNVPQTSTTERRENISRDRNDSSSASKSRGSDAPPRNQHTQGGQGSQGSAHSTLERLQKRADRSQSASQDESNNKNAEGSNASEHDSTAKTASNSDAQDTANTDSQNASSALTNEQKLALAEQNFSRSYAYQHLETPNAIDSIGPMEGSDTASSDLVANLKTVALSDQTQIITTNSAPNEKSLADFARAMGFDETQVAALFGPHAAQTLISGANSQFEPLLECDIFGSFNIKLSTHQRDSNR